VDLTLSPSGSPATLPTCCADAVPPAAPPTTRLMVSALTAAGLVNYPAHWWHWSYGDRFWAFVNRAPHARYGPVPPSAHELIR
jgi:D-alanyl-D-alanine dipeptidase